MIRKIINALWVLLAVALIAIVVVFVSISKGWIGYMPPVEELENPNYKFATEVFSEDGKVLGTFSMEKNNRVYSSYADLSPNIIHALIATEDVRFAEHSGIDAKALFRAIVKRGLLLQKSAGGGSTISQQLAKQLFTEKVASNTIQRLLQKPGPILTNGNGPAKCGACGSRWTTSWGIRGSRAPSMGASCSCTACTSIWAQANCSTSTRKAKPMCRWSMPALPAPHL